MSNIKRFGIVNQEVLKDPELSIQAKGLYSFLCTYADKNRECYPSRNTIADHCNISVTYVGILIKQLKKAGYLKREGRTITLK